MTTKFFSLWMRLVGILIATHPAHVVAGGELRMPPWMMP